jgi:type IV pilus assembly protein PilM
MTSFFGLDIGSSQVKAVQAEKSPQGYRLQHLGVETISGDGTAAAIQKLLKISGIKLSSEVNLALPESEIYSRIVNVPKLSDVELNSAIQYEAEQYVPVSLDEVELFHQILTESSSLDEKTMKVLLIAVPKARLKRDSDLMDQCGLIPHTLETELFALKRVLADPTRYQLLILLSHKTTDLMVVHRGEPILMHSLPSGGMALTRTLINEMNLSEIQAEQYKQAYGLRRDLLEGKVANVLTPLLNEIISQINKAYVFLNEQGYKKTPEQVVLAGGGSLLPGLTNFFVDKLSTEVLVADPFKNFIKDDNFKKMVTSASNPHWTTAVGLAIKDL